MTSSPPALDLKPQRPIVSLRPQSSTSVRPTGTSSTPTSQSNSGSATPTGTISSSSTSIASSTSSTTPSSTSSSTDNKKSYAGVSSTSSSTSSSSSTSTRGGYASRVAGTRGGVSTRPTGDRGTRDAPIRAGSGTPTKATAALRVSDRYSQPRETNNSNTNNNNNNTNKRPTPSITIPTTPIDSVIHSSNSPKNHPLECEWTFWFDSRSTQPQPRRPNEWGANLKEVGTFHDIEGFWRIFHHIQKPSQIEMNANYHLFKKGIRPAWEDPANQNGGKWTVKIGSRERQHLDAYWQNLVLSLLGETLDAGDELTGAVVSRRRAGDRITVWNRHRDHDDAIQEIGRSLRSVLPEDVTSNPSFELAYDSHGDHPAVQAQGRHAQARDD